MNFILPIFDNTFSSAALITLESLDSMQYMNQFVICSKFIKVFEISNFMSKAATF